MHHAYTREYLQWLEDRRRHPPSPPPPPSTPVQAYFDGHLRYILGARLRAPASTQSEPSLVSSSFWGRLSRLVDLFREPAWASAPASPICTLRQALNEDSEPDAEGGAQVLAHTREQQWRDQWGHEPGQSPQYYAAFFRDREPAYSRSEREMWEQRERYVFEEEVRRKDRLRKIRDQVQLGPWHGMTRDEKRRGKNKAKRAR
ncbi:hypothetical protein G6514_000677 [Epicoccum nigrum]|nr:hypothetical protein G6514_000677 [Epicoccum nigrum]